MTIDRRKVLSAAGAIAGLTVAPALMGEPAVAASPRAKQSSPRAHGTGLIAMEETCIPSSLMDEWQEALGGDPYPNDSKVLLQDFTGKRLEEMDAGGIDVAVLAVSVPSPQFIPDPVKANGMAERANDALAKEIAKRPDRFIGFASLSMHDPDQACKELQRATRDLGMRGVLLYNYQRAPNENHALFYDDRRYDQFWATLEQLDVPLYLHPGLLKGDLAGRDKDFAGPVQLAAAAFGFALHTGLHALRIITSGVFDRYPKAQMLLGHNGEHVVNDLWRIDNRIKMSKDLGPPGRIPIAKSVREYFRSNVHVTTSGEFSTPALKQVIAEIGVDRVMFAVDYPYESNIEGTKWFHAADIDAATRAAVGRENAVRLLKLT